MRLAILALVLVPAPALALDPACNLPQGWTKARPARAAIAAPLRYALVPGEAVTLALAPSTKVKYVVAPGRKPSPDSFGGLAVVQIAKAGTISVALSNRAYVDLVRGKALVSTGHREGCGGVRKSVDFAVKPGRYLIQIADAPEASVRMVVIGG